MRYRQKMGSDDERPDEYGVRVGEIVKYGFIAIAVVVVAALGFVWFVCRIDVPKGHFVCVLKKTGESMTNEMVLAPDENTKGPQTQTLGEGRHFRNPFFWWWTESIRATVVEEKRVGVRIRKTGKPLAEGAVIARADVDEKGILRDPLAPGRYYVSPWEYEVEIHPMVYIRPGHRGIVTLKVGKKPQDPNVFVVQKGERGTQPSLLTPGWEPTYSNPHVHLVREIDVRSQKFEMAGEYAVSFPSKYGFDIRVEGTIEWAPTLEKLPEVFVKYVDEKDLQESGGIKNIQRKIILPFARSYFRTIGGQYRAVDYITGDTRIKVQLEVERRLKEKCAAEGIEIRSFVIRSTEPPEQIRVQYSRREIAKRQNDRYEKEIITEIGSVVTEDGKPKKGSDGVPLRDGGRLAKIIQERQKDREMKLGQIRTQIVVAIRQAEQYKAVETTKAKRDLEVARINLEAAKDHAAAVIAQGKAQAEVMVMKNKAEAEAVRAKISAFGRGEKYAEYQLITKISPGIERILSNTEGLFARLFERFASMGAEKK